MALKKENYFYTFTILCLALAAYSGLQILGGAVYALAFSWVLGQEAGRFGWLSGLFVSPWTKTLVQYVLVLGIPSFLTCFIIWPVKKVRRPRRKLARGEFASGLVIAVGSGYFLNLLSVAVNSVLSLFTGRSLSNMNPAADMVSILEPGMVLYLCVVGPIMEEIMFRGVFLSRMRRFGDRTAVIATAVLFGMMHGNLTQLFYATAIGLVLGYLAVRRNGLDACIWLHIMINTHSVYLEAWGRFYQWAGIEAFSQMYVAASFFFTVFCMAMAVWFLATDGFRLRHRLNDGENCENPNRKYVWLNPGFFLFAAVTILEMMQYVL